MGISKIDNWFEPTDLLRVNPDYTKYTHMLHNEHGFLSGIIRKQRPKKVLEVGVAEGGTTALIIESLEMAECRCEMYSIDLAKSYNGSKVGFMKDIVKNIQFVDHTLFTETFLKNKIEDIGGEIDLVILDTTHNIPGEILEFLTCLPFLSKDAIVVLHDVNVCNYMATDSRKVIPSLRKICTKVLFTTVSGEKYFNYDNLENIAAFKISDSTMENIDDVFFSLSHLWYFGFSEKDLNEYRNLFSKYYSSSSLKLWDLLIENQNDYRKIIDENHKYLRLLENYNKFILKLKITFYPFYKLIRFKHR